MSRSVLAQKRRRLSRIASAHTAEQPVAGGATLWLVTGMLAAVISLIWAWLSRDDYWLVQASLWDIQNTANWGPILLSLAIHTALILALFAFTANALLRWQLVKGSRRPVWQAGWPLTLLILVCALISGNAVMRLNLLDLPIPLLGAATGLWLKPGRLLRRVGYLALAVLATAPVAAWLLLDNAPASPRGPALDSASRVELAERLRNKDPRAVPEGQTTTLSLSERQLNDLFDWALGLTSGERGGDVRLFSGGLAGDLTLPVSVRGRTGFLNITAMALPDIWQGQLRLHLDALRIGSLQFPPALLQLLSPALSAKLQSDPRATEILAAIDLLQITPTQVSLTYRRMQLGSEFREEVFGHEFDESFRLALTAQLINLKLVIAQANEARDPFLQISSQAFRLAGMRTEQLQSDAVMENRAALLALAVVLGHDGLAKLETAIPLTELPGRLYHRQFPLRDRSDWTRHFWVSAGLTVLSDAALSADAGPLKEELDAGTPNGSGFSFGDLAADMAGVALARSATANYARARHLQRLFIHNPSLDDLFPEVADLPEGLTDAQLLAEFDGVSGPRYSTLVAEIETRLTGCSLLQLD